MESYLYVFLDCFVGDFLFVRDFHCWFFVFSLESFYFISFFFSFVLLCLLVCNYRLFFFSYGVCWVLSYLFGDI